MTTSEKTCELLSRLKVKDELIHSFILGRRRSLSEKTQYLYALDLEFIQRHLDTPIEKANYNDIDGLITVFEKFGHGASTIQRRMAALSSFYEFLINHSAISCNPVKQSDLPKRKRMEQPYLNYMEYKQLLVAQRAMFKTYQKTVKDIEGIQFRSILSMFGLAGLRLGELRNLTIDDLHIHDVRIPFVHIEGKGQKFRDIPMHKLVLKTLKNWVQIRFKTTHRFLYINLHSLEPLSARTIQRKVKKIAEQCGTPKEVTPHGLCRSYATMLTEKSRATELDIMGLLGHSPRNPTVGYVGHSLDHQKELLDKIRFRDGLLE